MPRFNNPRALRLRFLQLLLLPLRVRKLLTYVCCSCERSSGYQIEGRVKQEEILMQRIVLNVFGLAVALGTSGLMFAATLA